MIQIFIVGSSTAYGVGGISGGWADRLKRSFHEKMYGANGLGEKIEVFNFAKSGATVEFVVETFPTHLKQYGRHGQRIVIVSVGGNDAKAVDTPDNFASTVEDFQQKMAALLTDLKAQVDQVIAVGYHPYDETKTLPKASPFSKSCSYFWNARTEKFSQALRQTCAQLGIKLIEPPFSQEEWVEKYASSDGLHPNDAGHEALFELIKDEIEL
jgi:lysophospholipase L1-like esterase